MNHQNEAQYNSMSEYISVYAVIEKNKKGSFLFSDTAVANSLFMPIADKVNIIENIIGNYPFKGLVCLEDKIGNLITDNPNILIIKQFMNNEFKVYDKFWSEHKPLIQGGIEDYNFVKIRIQPQHTNSLTENYYKY